MAWYVEDNGTLNDDLIVDDISTALSLFAGGQVTACADMLMTIGEVLRDWSQTEIENGRRPDADISDEEYERIYSRGEQVRELINAPNQMCGQRIYQAKEEVSNE